MAEASETQAWDRTALIWATIANAHRDSNQQPTPFSPGDVHPFRTPDDYKPQQPEIGDLSGLKAMFEATYGGSN